MRRFVGVSAAAFAVLLLAACSTLIPQGSSSSNPTQSSPSTSAVPTDSAAPESPTPTLTKKPTQSPIPPIETNKPTSLPAQCDDLGSAATRAATVDTLGFFPDVEVPTIIQGADVLVSCYWFAGDVTGLDIVLALVSEPDAVPVLNDAAAQGFTCTAENGYTMCRLDEEAKYFNNPYTVTSYYLYGSGVWLEAVGSNMDVTTLIDEVATSIWS